MNSRHLHRFACVWVNVQVNQAKKEQDGSFSLHSDMLPEPFTCLLNRCRAHVQVTVFNIVQSTR